MVFYFHSTEFFSKYFAAAVVLATNNAVHRMQHARIDLVIFNNSMYFMCIFSSMVDLLAVRMLALL